MSMSIKADPSGTFGEILVNGTTVAKLPVSGNAVIPGLVGTVSQSGGVPTGAIIERGSNANGSYVRFADGTQICTVERLLSTNNNAGTSVTLPAVFINASFVCVGSATTYLTASLGGSFVTEAFAGSSSTIVLKVLQHLVGSTADANQTVRAVAIGSWF